MMITMVMVMVMVMTMMMLCAGGRHQHHRASVLGLFTGQHRVATVHHHQHQVHSSNSIFFTRVKIPIVALVLACMT